MSYYRTSQRPRSTSSVSDLLQPSVALTSTVGTSYWKTKRLTEPLCKKLDLCYNYVFSRISNHWLHHIGFFYVSVNYLKYIFTSKIKKIKIVIYVLENMVWTSFKIYSSDLLQNKVTRLDFMFLGYGVHTL